MLNSDLHIIQTLPDDESFKLFLQLPASLYPSASIRLLQADAVEAKYLDACYVVMKNNIPVARAAVFINPFLNHHNMPTACLGHYECVEDDGVAQYLFQSIFMTIKAKSINYIIGPMNGSTWNNYRFSEHNNFSVFFSEPFHHLYYNQHFLKNNFAPIARYTSNISRDLIYDKDEMLVKEAALLNVGFKIRQVDLSNFENELKQLHSLTDAIFKNHFLYTPMGWQSFRDKYLEAKAIINPAYLLIVEKDSEAAGFVFCFDDFYNQNEKSLIIKTIGRRQGKQYAGVGEVLYNYIIRKAKSDGYVSIINAFMIESSTSNFLSKKYNSNPFKNYILYGKAINW